MRRWILILTIWLSFATFGRARDLHVNNVDGNDRYDGRAPVVQGQSMGPLRTIARALRIAQKGDRVIIANTGQPYRESITLQSGRHSGMRAARFELIGNGALLDGSHDIPAHAWTYYSGNVFQYRPLKMHFQVLYRDGKPAERMQVTEAAQIDDLKPLQWCLFEGRIYFCTEPGRLPQTYNLTHTALPVGITLYEVRHVTIRDLVVQGFQLDGVNAHDGVTDTTLVSLTCRGNGRSGISVGGASRVQIKACLVGNNGAVQVRAEGPSHTQLVGCDLLGTDTAPGIDHNEPSEVTESR